MSRFKSLTKTIFIFIFIAVTLIFLINIGLSLYLKNKIKNIKGEYAISIKDAKVNVVTQSITVNNIIINSKKKEKDSLYFDTDELHISGISLSDIRNPKSINLSNIKISSPNIKIYKGDTTSGNGNALKDLKSFNVKKINIKNGEITFFSAESDTTWHIKKINLAYKNFSVDSNSIKNR